MVLNSHKILERETGVKMSFMDFVLEVVNSLIISLPPIPQPENIVHNDHTVRLVGRHFIGVKKSTEGSLGKHPSKNCRVCYATGKRTAKGKPLKTLAKYRVTVLPVYYYGELYETVDDETVDILS